MEKMKIEIWSDIACPYCYIGKRKFELALSQFAHADELDLVWKSYELNPALPRKASEKMYYEYMAEVKNQTVDEAKESFKHLIALAQEVGLEYNLDKLVVTNTEDALRLVKLADKYNLADEAEEVLFKAYFTDGKNISDKEVLLQLGTSIGLPQGDIGRMLDCFEYAEEIKRDMKRAEEQLSLEYIPFYLLNSKHIIQGSIPQADYLDVLQKAYDDWKQNGESDGQSMGDIISGQSCSIDGVCS